MLGNPFDIYSIFMTEEDLEKGKMELVYCIQEDAVTTIKELTDSLFVSCMLVDGNENMIDSSIANYYFKKWNNTIKNALTLCLKSEGYLVTYKSLEDGMYWTLYTKTVEDYISLVKERMQVLSKHFNNLNEGSVEGILDKSEEYSVVNTNYDSVFNTIEELIPLLEDFNFQRLSSDIVFNYGFDKEKLKELENVKFMFQNINVVVGQRDIAEAKSVVATLEKNLVSILNNHAELTSQTIETYVDPKILKLKSIDIASSLEKLSVFIDLAVDKVDYDTAQQIVNNGRVVK